MKTTDLQHLIQAITGQRLVITERTKGGQWYERQYSPCEEIKPSTYYRVQSVGNDAFVDFDFQTGKTSEGFLKTFAIKYCKEIPMFDKGRELNKDEKMERLVKNAHSARLSFSLMYTTLYGVGMWVLFVPSDLKKQLDAEYSDAMWVYRYKFNAPIDRINTLFAEFKAGRN